MAERILPPEYLAAGRDYLAALRKLGLHPEGLFWAFDDAVDEPALVLVTGYLDRVGPFELNRLLFRAYNLAATPKSISPFLIRLHSPHDDVAAVIDGFVKQWGGPGLNVAEAGKEGGTWNLIRPIGGRPIDPAVRVSAIGIANTSLHAFANGLYVWREPPRFGRTDKQWANIQHSVDELEDAA